jgi:hypothetical protein
LPGDGEAHGSIRAWRDREPWLWRLGREKAWGRDDETWDPVGLGEHEAGLVGVCLEEVVHQVGTDCPHPDEQRQG